MGLVRDARIDLWNRDECHFEQYSSRIRVWVSPEDVDPIQLLLAPACKSIGLFGAVNMKRRRLLAQFEKKFNAMVF
jgi:hypothetical protein